MLTKLDVVNAQLATMGQAPLLTEAAIATHPLGPTGLLRLRIAQRQFQTEGWWFNTMLLKDLQPAADGEVELPCGVLRLKGLGEDAVAIRGDKLYDIREGATRLTVIPRVNAVVELDFLDLPPVPQIHVMNLAVLDFQQDYDSTDSRRAILRDKVAASLVAVNAEHTRTRRANRLRMPSTLAKLHAIAWGNRGSRIPTQ